MKMHLGREENRGQKNYTQVLTLLGVVVTLYTPTLRVPRYIITHSSPGCNQRKTPDNGGTILKMPSIDI